MDLQILEYLDLRGMIKATAEVAVFVRIWITLQAFSELMPGKRGEIVYGLKECVVLSNHDDIDGIEVFLA